jgi:hypothetical protein
MISMILSENATGADNQQERLQHISDDLGHYLSGFADGEGSFNISVVRRQSDYRSGWKIVASFNISQREATIPKLFQETLQCGTIRYRQDGVCYFEIRKIIDIHETVHDFFDRFPLRSVRQSQRLQLLLQATEIIVKGEHLNPQGLEAVLAIREQMNSNRKRKYTMTDVLQNPQRLYARTARAV